MVSGENNKEIQSDSTLPPNEIITASERLTLIRSEIDLRHGDASHGQTQRLARWAIGVGMVFGSSRNYLWSCAMSHKQSNSRELACGYWNANCCYTHAHGIANGYTNR
jgi:hypothetical protein